MSQQKTFLVDKFIFFYKIFLDNILEEKKMADKFNCTEVKPGMTFIWENDLYQCIDIALNKTAMAKMKVKIKVKAPRTGVVKELSLISGDKVESAYIEKKEMQYLYNDGENLCFMDNDTFDQIEIPAVRLDWEKNFLTESMMVKISMYEGEVLGVILPDKVEMELVECEEAVKGNTATSAEKNAVTETGLEVRVPMFIKNGERIIISTADGKYSGRA